MGIFKMAADVGIRAAREKVSGADEWGADNTVDVLHALAPLATPHQAIPLVASALTAPGGHWISGPLRETFRSGLEAALGAAGGLGLGMLASRATGAKGYDAELLRDQLGRLGAQAGAVHGAYASRRNQRQDTGDYSALGFNRDKKKDRSKE